MAECLGCKQVKMNLVKLGEESQDAIRELMTMTGTLKAEIERLKQANENNLEGWRQNVAGLQREIERLRKRIREIQEAADKRNADLASQVAYWHKVRDQARERVGEDFWRHASSDQIQRLTSLEAEVERLKRQSRLAISLVPLRPWEYNSVLHHHFCQYCHQVEILGHKTDGHAEDCPWLAWQSFLKAKETDDGTA